MALVFPRCSNSEVLNLHVHADWAAGCRNPYFELWRGRLTSSPGHLGAELAQPCWTHVPDWGWSFLCDCGVGFVRCDWTGVAESDLHNSSLNSVYYRIDQDRFVHAVREESDVASARPTSALRCCSRERIVMRRSYGNGEQDLKSVSVVVCVGQISGCGLRADVRRRLIPN